MTAARMAPPSRWLLFLTLGVVAVFTVLRLITASQLDLRSDEAYYWTWTQQSPLSFLDQPPMVAWFERMGQLLGGKGKVLVLRYAEGSASTTEREAGFIDTIKQKYPEIELVSTDQYAGATRDTAKRASENLLNRFGDEVQGIFTPNESSTAGMLLALEDIGKAGKVSFVGFDVSQRFIDALNAGQLHGIIVQNPFNMGYLGVKTMVESLVGRPVADRIDTGVMLVTKENMSSPEVNELLHPPLDQYLK